MQGTGVGNVFGVFEIKQGASVGGGEVGNETKEQARGVKSCGALRTLAFVWRDGKLWEGLRGEKRGNLTWNFKGVSGIGEAGEEVLRYSW